MYGGWGNDLLNADDVMTVDGAGTFGDQKGRKIQPSPNDTPDTHPLYEDRAYGGAGLDVLIGNTGGDRLIDWVGEFNSYIVPFAPFGIATVSRQVPPWLYEFLYALSASQGADPTRDEDQNAADPELKARNGEPYGELGLVTQKDHGLWQDQTGGPSDPQPGNIPGGARDVKRSADFGDGTLQTFAVDSGVWSVSAGVLTVAAQSQGQDAAAVWYHDQYLPVYYELFGRISIKKPTGGWKGNAYAIFDYFGPTDFKFAGLDDASNKLVIGYRDATRLAPRHVGLDPRRRQVRHVVRPARRGQRHAGHGDRRAAASRELHVRAAGDRRRLVRPQQGSARVRLRQLARHVRQRPAAHAAGAADARPLRELRRRRRRLARRRGRHPWVVALGTGATTARRRAVSACRSSTSPQIAYDAYLGARRRGSRRHRPARLVFDYYDAVRLQVRRGRRRRRASSCSGTASAPAWIVDQSVDDHDDPTPSTTPSASSLRGASVSVVVDGQTLISFGYNSAVVDGRFGLLISGIGRDRDASTTSASAPTTRSSTSTTPARRR